MRKRRYASVELKGGFKVLLGRIKERDLARGRSFLVLLNISLI